MSYENRKVIVPPGVAGKWTVQQVQVLGDEEGHHAELAPWHLEGAPIGEYTALLHEDDGLVMIDAPAILATHDADLSLAHGHVVVGGLGLGAFAIAAASLMDVDRVTVIEIDQNVIDLARDATLAMGHQKIEIILGDVRAGPFADLGSVDLAWLDIWPDDTAGTWAEREAMVRAWWSAGHATTWRHEHVRQKAVSHA